MTKKELWKMFHLFAGVVVRDKDDLFSYAPSVHLIDHCGGYELELHPTFIMFERDIMSLCAMADKLCHTVECRFYDGSIIIR